MGSPRLHTVEFSQSSDLHHPQSSGPSLTFLRHHDRSGVGVGDHIDPSPPDSDTDDQFDTATLSAASSAKSKGPRQFTHGSALEIPKQRDARIMEVSTSQKAGIEKMRQPFAFLLTAISRERRVSSISAG